MEWVNNRAKGKFIIGLISLVIGVLSILCYQYLWQDQAVPSIMWAYIRDAYAYGGVACVAFGGVVVSGCFHKNKEVSQLVLQNAN
jgi:hypothetical protein